MNGRFFCRLVISACLVIGLSAFYLIASSIDTPVEGIKMPGTIVLDHIQKRYAPVSFDHAMHVTLAEGCGQCHHEHHDKKNATCKECHVETKHFKSSVKQGFLPCSGCHGDYSPEKPEVPGLMVALHRKCFQCHVGIGDLGTSPQGCTAICHAKK